MITDTLGIESRKKIKVFDQDSSVNIGVLFHSSPPHFIQNKLFSTGHLIEWGDHLLDLSSRIKENTSDVLERAVIHFHDSRRLEKGHKKQNNVFLPQERDKEKVDLLFSQLAT